MIRQGPTGSDIARRKYRKQWQEIVGALGGAVAETVVPEGAGTMTGPTVAADRVTKVRTFPKLMIW